MEYVNELDTISAGAAKKEAALKVHRLTFMEATMMVVGSTIGSGVLGLAFASRNAGWPVLLTWLVVAGFFSIISMLYVAEATLRTTRPLQLSGLAEKYVGKIGSWLIFFSVGATSFCSLIAYTSGCGKILSEFFGISLEMASCLFALGATSVVWLGLKATGVAEKYLSSGMTAMLILLVGASLFSARVPVADILYTHWMYAVPVFNIAVFCYAVQYIVPEISRGFTHEPGKLVPSILAGAGISFVILALVPLAVFLMLPVDEISEVASLSWGRALGSPVFFVIVNAFAFCAMLTSFWAIAESFLTNMIDRLASSRKRTFARGRPAWLHRHPAGPPGLQRPRRLRQRHLQRRHLRRHHHVHPARLHAAQFPETRRQETVLAMRLDRPSHHADPGRPPLCQCRRLRHPQPLRLAACGVVG